VDNKVLEYAILSGTLSGNWSGINKIDISLEDLNIFKESNGAFLETIAANKGSFTNLPPKLIGEDGLLYKDKELKIRVIHLAAQHEVLSIIPKKYLTQENLSARNPLHGYTAFHYAARHGCLNDIPPYLRSERNLMTRANNDQTPLELAVGMVIALRKSNDTEVVDKVKRVKNGINIILTELKDHNLQKLENWYVDKEILAYIKKEIGKRKILKEINNKRAYIDI
jgi:hypothetical protein